MSPANKSPQGWRRSGAADFATAPDAPSVPHPAVDPQGEMTVAFWRYLAAHNLRTLCIHEHAHRIVAMHVGALGQVIIQRVGGGQQRYYTGVFRARAQLQERTARLIGLAGTVAQCYDADHDLSAGDIEEAISDLLIDFSATDQQLAAGYDTRDIAECLSIVRERWTGILEAALLQAAMVAIETNDETAA